ncbi:MAG: hypothetical protein K0S71_2260 [Clostridia bacterium]|jgi:hypothetical protein|nr:hypothetical protein [Clostridia bacterium]
MGVELLLKEIAGISNKYDLISQKTGGHFNIFNITDIAADEVRICRVLYELLNPKGTHYQKDAYLRLFIEYVLQVDLSSGAYETLKVYREYILPNSRRIDLVIENKDYFIPIEVKIYAGDQEKQCYDYYQRAKNANVYYLTLEGNPPSEYSAAGLTKSGDGYKEVTTISFKNEILLWLTKCLEHKETIKIAPIREVVLQLISVIRKLTNQLEEGKEMEIQNIITASKENMISAIEIEKSLKVCKIEMMYKVLRAIEERLGKEKIINEFDYEYNNGEKINNYYERKNSTFPGISYPYKKDVKKGVDIWFRVEIDWKLFAGFCVPLHGKPAKQQLSEDEIKRHIPKFEPEVDNWWAYWEFLPVDYVDMALDFKVFNEAYFNLFDAANFEKFVDQCVDRIKEIF